MGKKSCQTQSLVISESYNGIQIIDTRKTGEISCLRIGMVDSFAATIGASLIRQLDGCAEKIKVHSGIAPYLQEPFQKGELDLIITMGPLPVIENSASIRILWSPICWRPRKIMRRVQPLNWKKSVRICRLSVSPHIRSVGA